MLPLQHSYIAKQQNLNGAVRGIPSLPFRRQPTVAKLYASVRQPTFQSNSSSLFGQRVKEFGVRGGQIKLNREAVKVQAFMGGNSVDPLRIAIQVVSIIIAGAVAWVLNQPRQLEQDNKMEAQACPRCGGSGVEPCWCQNWSDGDVGCSSCNRSGYMQCRSCGGGGIATPLPVQVNNDRR